MAIIDDLQFFDAGQLAGFALDLSQKHQNRNPGQETDYAESSLSFDYEIDLKKKSQRLRSDFIEGYGQFRIPHQRHSRYDMNSAIDAAGRQLLDGLDVRALGKPAPYQSEHVNKPDYYQGALRALSSNIDRLAALLEDPAVRQVSAEPEKDVVELFRKLADNHPACKEAGQQMQQSLGRMFDLLPSLVKHAPQLNRTFHEGAVRVNA